MIQYTFEPAMYPYSCILCGEHPLPHYPPPPPSTTTHTHIHTETQHSIIHQLKLKPREIGLFFHEINFISMPPIWMVEN